MPRIRNWKTLKFYIGDKNLILNHIESLFKDTINWGLIETHYEDSFQVALSIERTNKLESNNGYSKWFFFGGEGIMCENNPEEKRKIIKYNNLLAHSVILHNAVDIYKFDIEK